jgi:hypothetical protein
MTLTLTRADIQINMVGFMSGAARSKLIPDAEFPVVVFKPPGRADMIYIRTASVLNGSDGDYDETIMRQLSQLTPAGYNGTSEGLMLVGRSIVAGGIRKTWMEQPEALGSNSLADFGIRQGRYDQPYSASSGDYSDFCGFLHGNFTGRTSANASAYQPSIGSSALLDGLAPNYFTPGNWPAGTMFRGTSFNVFQNFDCERIGSTDVLSTVQYSQTWSSAGLVRDGYWTRVGTNTGHNDWVSAEYPANADANTIKFQDLDPITLNQSLTTKPPPSGYTDIQPVGGFTALHMSVYDAAEPTVMDTLQLAPSIGPLRQIDGGGTLWGYNSYVRAQVIDNAEFGKAYFFAASNPENPAPQTAWELNEPMRWYNTLRGKIGTPL